MDEPKIPASLENYPLLSLEMTTMLSGIKNPELLQLTLGLTVKHAVSFVTDRENALTTKEMLTKEALRKSIKISDNKDDFRIALAVLDTVTGRTIRFMNI